MTSKAAATRYARALFDVALKEKTDLQQIDAQLAGFVQVVSEHQALAKVLLNPAVPVPRKRAAVAELAARLEVAPVLAKLLALLAERDRLIVLSDLLASYRDRLLDYQQIVRAEVTTAVPLSEGQAREIERCLARATGKTVTVRVRVDPDIIGGVVARLGSTVYDASITRQLERMRTKLAQT